MDYSSGRLLAAVADEFDKHLTHPEKDNSALTPGENRNGEEPSTSGAKDGTYIRIRQQCLVSLKGTVHCPKLSQKSMNATHGGGCQKMPPGSGSRGLGSGSIDSEIHVRILTRDAWRS